MSTQQDIYAASSESRPPMLNKENYVPWSSRLLRYAKSRPNGKLIHNSILNGPYVRKMIREPGDANRDITTKDLHTADYTQLYDFLKYNQKENYLQQPMPNPEDITDPTTTMNMALALMAKAFKLNYSTPTNNNQRILSNPRNRQIAQPGQNTGNPAGYNDVIGNQIGNGNLVVARTEGNATGQNGNQIRCYNCRGVEEYDLMAAAADLDEIEEVNANCILMANLQQASTSGTQTDSAPVYDTDGSAEVHENYDDNEIFNMFTQEEQYTELLEPIPESHQVPQNDNDVISEDTSMEQDLSDDTTPSVARKFLNDVKSIILTLQRVVKQRMTIETHNWASSAHQEFHKIVREEIFPIVNQVDDRVQNFEIQFLKESAKFVGDFKSLAKEADDSLAKHKAMELDNERLL
nr:Gag-Pol polyprotein [Tanacetum cinerariifolium]